MVSIDWQIWTCLFQDDPLSALDVHVGSQIFNEAIMQFLVDDGKTVLLVTHQLQYLSKAHKVAIMDWSPIIDCLTCQK